MNNLTVVITNAGRADLLWKAFKSCRDAGVKNIVVASAILDDEILSVHGAIKDFSVHGVKKVDTEFVCFKDDPGCNATWLAGVKAAKTDWVHILHDDDLILPAYRDVGFDFLLSDPRLEFVLFDSGSHNAELREFKVIHEHVDLWTKQGGLFPCAAIRDRLLREAYSISPVSGIFRKNHLVDVLTEFALELSKKKWVLYRPKMEVGNDLLIWLRATELPGYFYYIKTSLVSYGSHPGSATCSDMGNKDKKLPAIYDATKEYFKSNRKQGGSIRVRNVASFCYIPDISKARGFLQHLGLFNHQFPIHILTDGPIESSPLPVTQIPKIGPFTKAHGLCKPSVFYANIAFLRAIERAKFIGLEYFIWLESDCRFTEHNWDEKMCDEFFSVTGGLFGGTPVCWHPWAGGEANSQKIIKYAYDYQRKAGVAMAFEGEHSSQWGTAIYPNGALAIYHLETCLRYFADQLKCLDQPLHIQERMVAKYHAFDLHIGRSLVREFGIPKTLKKLIPISCVYSGCGEHHVRLEQRIRMINSRLKVAVHQIK